MAVQAARLSMFASDGWFWEDPARVETQQIMRFAAYAARGIDELSGSALEAELMADLVALRSPGTGQDGIALYRDALATAKQPAPSAKARRTRSATRKGTST
jgi:hypothetical protein